MLPDSTKPILTLSSFNTRMRRGVAFFTSVKVIYLVFFLVCIPFTLAMLFLMTSINILLFITIIPIFILLSAIFVYYLYVTTFKYLYYHRKRQHWQSSIEFGTKVSHYRLKWIGLLSAVLIVAYISLPQQTTLLMLNIILVWATIDSIFDIYASHTQDRITEFYHHNGTISARCIEKYPHVGMTFFREWFWPPNKNNEFELTIYIYTKGYRKNMVRYQKANSLTIEEFEQKKTTQNKITKQFFMLCIYAANIPNTFVLNYLVADQLTHSDLSYILLTLQSHGHIKIMKDSNYSIQKNILSSKKPKISKNTDTFQT